MPVLLYMSLQSCLSTTHEINTLYFDLSYSLDSARWLGNTRTGLPQFKWNHFVWWLCGKCWSPVSPLWVYLLTQNLLNYNRHRDHSEGGKKRPSWMLKASFSLESRPKFSKANQSSRWGVWLCNIVNMETDILKLTLTSWPNSLFWHPYR